METSNNDQTDSILMMVAEKLIQAKHELDELAVQLSLGKADARDKFEEIKDDFRTRLNELKQIAQSDSQKSAVINLVAKVIELETALLTGKAGSKKLFDAQKKMIMAAIAGLENVITEKFGSVPAVHDFIHDIEKFRLKLEILRLKFMVKKFKIKESFRNGMDEAIGVVRSAGLKARRARDNYRNFRDEIGLAYGHMKKAVKKM